MTINIKIENISGSFDTKEVLLVPYRNSNRGIVEILANEPGYEWNTPIGEIKLYSDDRCVDLNEILKDTVAFAKEICRRFNEFPEELKK